MKERLHMGPMRGTLGRFLMAAALAAVVLLPWSRGEAAAGREHVIKAVFLYNFLNYIVWPESAEDSANATLCIYGADPFGNTLSQLQRRIKHERPVKIRRITKSDVQQIEECNILFVSRIDSPDLSFLADSGLTAGVLTVSDIEAFARHYGIVEFATVNDKVKLKINEGRLRRSGLKANSQLMAIATIVR